MRFFLLISSLAAALAAAGCTATSRCQDQPDGTQRCEDIVYLDDHATGEGQAALSCVEPVYGQTSLARELSSIAECEYTPEKGLLVRVGSNSCDNLAVVLRDFSGAGTYVGDGTLEGPVHVSLYTTRPESGCSDPLVFQSSPLESCGIAPDPCTVEVTGDVTPTRGGDISLRIHCGQLVYGGVEECSACTPTVDMTLDIEDCEPLGD